MSKTDEIPKLKSFDGEIEDAILNLVISLCKNKEHRGFSLAQAKEQTAIYLDRLSDNLRKIEEGN